MTEAIPFASWNAAVVIPYSINERQEVVDRAIKSTLGFKYRYLEQNQPKDGTDPDIQLWFSIGEGRTGIMRRAAAYYEDNEDVQWLIILDADDELVIGDFDVQDLLPGVYNLQLQHGELRYWQPRVFHISVFREANENFEGCIWVGNTHECWEGPRSGDVDPGVLAYKVNEDGYRRVTGLKLREDLELLRADIGKPGVSQHRTRFYLAQTLAELGKTEEAFWGYKECLEDETQWAQERYIAGWRMLNMLAPEDAEWSLRLNSKIQELDPLRPEGPWFEVRQYGWQAAQPGSKVSPALVTRWAQEIKRLYRQRAGSEAAVRASNPLFLDARAMEWAWGPAKNEPRTVERSGTGDGQ